MLQCVTPWKRTLATQHSLIIFSTCSLLSFSSSCFLFPLFSSSFLLFLILFLSLSDSPQQGPCCNSSTCQLISPNEEFECRTESECALNQTCKYPLFQCVCVCVCVCRPVDREFGGFRRTAHCAWSKHEKLLSALNTHILHGPHSQNGGIIYSLAYQQYCNRPPRQPAWELHGPHGWL